MPEPLTSAERRLRWLLIGHAVLSAILAVTYIADGNTDVAGYIPNSFAKDMLFVAISAIGAADVRRRGWAALVVAGGYVALVIGQTATLLWGGAPGMYGLSGTAFLLGWMAIDVVLIVWFVWWWWAAVRAAHGLKYLNPIAFLGLVALAEVLIEGRREAVSPRDVALRVDRYLASLQSRNKLRVHAALTVLAVWPVLPPLPAFGPAARRRFLQKRFVEEIGERRLFAPLRPVVEAIVRSGAQMSYLGYYGAPRGQAAVGYKPFVDRPGGRPPGDLPEPPLRALAAPPRRRYDTIVIGSGAAGSVLAYRFAEAGRRVLVLERGPHVDPRDFTDDEVDQYLLLYNEGALELAANFSLQVLQGMCVGGGTTINNALCLSPPGRVLDDWAERGLDRARLEDAIGEIRTWLDVTRIRPEITTKAARRFADAVHELGLPGDVELMEANITRACVGTGYCNIGCAYGGKKAALDFILPSAQRQFGLDVLAEARAEEILSHGDRATGVAGTRRGERFAVMADEIVVAAGPIASSWLLQRSGVGGDQVGRDLHFNINSPLTAELPDEVDSFAGIQMSHAYRPPGDPPPFLVETWFNPPATQSLAMPGWFGRHFDNMGRYRNMACAGVLVGTTTPGRVTAGGDGPRIEYNASEKDMAALVDGLKVAGRIWMQAGATRVMPATFKWHEFTTPDDLDHLDEAVDGDLFMTSAHPQGGNALGTVVDEDFRVRGLANLYLCDASVFPTSVHVNPQLTVMGMAQYAAGRLLT